MEDFREQFIKRISASLIGTFDEAEVEIITNDLIMGFKGYELVRTSADFEPCSDENDDVLDKFCACLKISGRSEKTIAMYKRTVLKLEQAIKRKYTTMKVYDIRMFLAMEKARGISNRTLENTRANLSAFFQWLTNEDLINKNPCANVSPIKYTDKVRTPLSPVEIDSLRTACRNSKERAIIELLLSSGIRVSEMTNIKIADINFNNMSIHITKGKGAKERTVYINSLAKKHILEYLDCRNVDGEYLFYNIDKTPLHPGGVRHILKSVAKRAGVDNVHPHRFRRTFATGLADRGMDVREIQKLLGHSNVDTTLEYVYTSDERAHTSYLKYSA